MDWMGMSSSFGWIMTLVGVESNAQNTDSGALIKLGSKSLHSEFEEWNGLDVAKKAVNKIRIIIECRITIHLV